ncbi:MAG: DegT/DnrJ/EryC1/StrS family aminotransferase [Acidimicrobiales bacterium]
MSRIYLSPPDVGPAEREALLAAFDAGWIAPVGPEVDAFERDVAAATGTAHAAALSSGTAAQHQALQAARVGPGDEVVVPTLTFVATASPVVHIGAEPTFVDCEPGSWNIDPSLVADLLDERAQQGRMPAAVIAVDLYGQCADADALAEACRPHGVVLIEDAAEALGATYHGRPAGSLAPIGVISFNGNKIITTSGGGMLVSDDEAVVARARHLATQAREPAPHYEHIEIGFNYRMSNLLAALGRAQLRSLPERVARRRAIKARYRAALEDGHGITFMPDAPSGVPTNWLTVAQIDADRFGATADDIRLALEASDVESRPAWKPLHCQPVFADRPAVGGTVAERIFERGLCLPSGSSLTDDQVDRIVELVRAVPRH